MAAYPALVQLVRMLGRADTLAALGLDTEPDPAELSPSQRQRLTTLIDVQIENIATELVDEAAASDDVCDRGSAQRFIADQVSGFRDLLTEEQALRLDELIAASVADWG